MSGVVCGVAPGDKTGHWRRGGALSLPLPFCIGLVGKWGLKLPFQNNGSLPLSATPARHYSVVSGHGSDRRANPQTFGLWLSQAHPTHPGCRLIWKKAKDAKASIQQPLQSVDLGALKASRPSTVAPTLSEVRSCHSGPGPQTPWCCPPVVLSPKLKWLWLPAREEGDVSRV